MLNLLHEAHWGKVKAKIKARARHVSFLSKIKALLSAVYSLRTFFAYF